MDPPYRPQRIDGVDALSDYVDGLLRPGEYSDLDHYMWSALPSIMLPRLGSLPSNISPQSYHTALDLRTSNVSPSQSNPYYSAVPSPSHSTTTNTGSTLSSNMSFPYSVTSITSRKSRKNVLYPRRAHPMPPPEPLPVPLLPPEPAVLLPPPEFPSMSHRVGFFF